MSASTTVDPRGDARKRFINRMDPIFLLLDRFIFESLFRPPKKNVPGTFEELDIADTDFLVENLNKHRLILWYNIALAVFLASWGLRAIMRSGDPALIVTGLLAPAVITGAAWYTLTFGGISEKFLGTAMTITRWMFASFSMSMTLLVGLLCYITPWPIGLFILVPIYAGLYISSILYDNVDGLKIGLDTTMLKFSRASLNYYQKQGFLTREETQTEVFDETAASSEQIALFTHHLTMLQHNLTQLKEQKPLPVANHLIASSTDHLFRMLELWLAGKEIDKGDNYESYLSTAHERDQDSVDAATIGLLHTAVETLRATLGNAAGRELQIAKSALDEFARIRSAATDDPSGATDGGHRQSRIDQALADYLFIQVFQQLMSLMNAHRHLLFRKQKSVLSGT